MINHIDWEGLAQRLKTSRDLSGLTQEESAKLLHINRRSVQEHEKGAHPRTGLIKRYASIYKVDSHWLMTGESSQGIVTEDAAPYGRTSEVMVDGKAVKITSFEPKSDAEQSEPNILIREALAAIMEKDRENHRLRVKIQELTEKLATIRLFYLTHEAARQQEEIQPLLKQLDIPLDTNKHGEKS